MGSAQSSTQPLEDDLDDDDEEEEEEEKDEEEEEREPLNPPQKKVLQQEPEILTCHASASPISPQLSTLGTPRLLAGGPSIKVWDPYNVLGPPPARGFAGGGGSGLAYGLWDRVTEVFLICHGECEIGLRPELVEGRWPTAVLTVNGERQARALAVFLNSQGVRFNAVYSSPLERARATAASVCQELGFAEEQIQSSDSLLELSNGQWEGCHRSEIFTAEMFNLIERTQPDFSSPSGESLRQVVFRMIEFLNRTVIRMSDKLSTSYMLMHQNEYKAFSRQSSTDSVQDHNGSAVPHWDLLHRHHKQVLSRKKSGKSRLQFVTTGDNETEDDFSQWEANQLNEVNNRNSTSSVGLFTHATPIKCLITGLLECSPAVSTKICIDDSSVTVLEHSLRTGWRIKKLNDTAHLRLL